MKGLPVLLVWLLAMAHCAAADPAATTETEAIQWQRIYERLEKLGITNAEKFLKSPLGQGVIVHPSFGIFWDEVPPPTLTNASAMAGVNAFIATNGWNMHSNKYLMFTYGFEHPRPIRGLPWEVIRDREFPALTHRGILYVILSGGFHNVSGVAYNPNTNRFAGANGFKPLGGHWYVWAQVEDSWDKLPKVYEGSSFREPDGGANGSQPIDSETNRASGAAGSRR